MIVNRHLPNNNRKPDRFSACRARSVETFVTSFPAELPQAGLGQAPACLSGSLEPFPPCQLLSRVPRWKFCGIVTTDPVRRKAGRSLPYFYYPTVAWSPTE